MAQGMSENDVKRKLYGEFGEIKRTFEKKPDVAKPAKEPAAKKINRKRTIPVKPVIITVGIIIFLLMFSAIVRSCRTGREGPYSQIKGYLSQGKKYYNEGMFDEAILTWKNILAIDQTNRSALRYIQRAELKKKELKIKEEEIARKLKEMLARREKEEGEKKQREEKKKYGKLIMASVKNLLEEGDAYLREGNFQKAIAAYEKVLKLSPGERHAVKNIARAEKELAKYRKEKVAEGKEEVSVPKETGPQYTIQVATYADEVHAKELAKKLYNKGFGKVSVSKVSSSKAGKSWYCVYSGLFSSKDEAEKEMQKIKKEGFSDTFVKTLK